MTKLFPEIRELSLHPIWTALESGPLTIEQWHRELLRVGEPTGPLIDAALCDPFELLVTLGEPDRFAACTILLKSSPALYPHRWLAFGRGLENSLAKLALRPEWYPARARLLAVLKDQFPESTPAFCNQLHWFADVDSLDLASEAYRRLRNWQLNISSSSSGSEMECIRLFSAIESAAPNQRYQIVQRLVQPPG